MLNNIVGLKPSLGLVSTAGVVPACRTLDCVSVFSLTVDDAVTALAAMAGPDAADPFSRDRPLGAITRVSRRAAARRAARRPADLLRRQGLGGGLRRGARSAGRALGATLVEFDIEPFYETARLLYEGPWVAERYLVIRDLLASSPGCDPSGDARDHRRPARGSPPPTPSRRSIGCRRCARSPSAPSPTSTRWCCRPRRRSIRPRRCWPIRSSSTAGSAPTPISSICSISAASRCRRRCAPTACRSASRCWRPAGSDALLASIGRVFHADTRLPLGAKGLPQPPLAPLPARARGDEIADRGGRRASVRHGAERRIEGARRPAAGSRRRPRRTTSSMRSTTTPPKPGMLRVEAGQRASRSSWRSGRCRRRRSAQFVAAIPPPLSIGTVAPGRRPRREGIYRRSRRRRRRARYFRVRRLARVYGGSGGGVMSTRHSCESRAHHEESIPIRYAPLARIPVYTDTA